MFKTINLRKILSSLIVTLGVGFLAGALSGNMGNIYQSFNKPLLSPPPAVFGAVWTALYIDVYKRQACFFMRPPYILSGAVILSIARTFFSTILVQSISVRRASIKALSSTFTRHAV